MNDRTQGFLSRSLPLQFLGLWGLAVAQPIYDLIARYPEFLSVKRVSPFELSVFVLLLSFALPLGVGGGLALLRRGVPRIEKWISSILAFTLLFLISILLLKGVGIVGWKRLLLGASVSAGVGTYAYFKAAAFRGYVAALSLLALVFPLYFLSKAQIRAFLVPQSTLGAPIAAAPTQGGPLVVVVFDELPLLSLLESPGQLDARHFPNFSELANTSTWFPNAWAASSDTTTAVPAILSGKFPKRGQLPRLQDQPHNLFTLLGPHYKVLARESVTTLCPEDICPPTPLPLRERLTSLLLDVGIVYAHRVVPSHFSSHLPPIGLSWGNFLEARGAIEHDEDDVVVDPGEPVEYFQSFLTALPSANATPGNWFGYMHVLLPHPPWHYFPSGKSYTSPAGMVRFAGLATDDEWEKDEQAAAEAYLRHLLQVQYADALLGQLMSTLKQRGLFDQATIVVVADHGTSFRAGHFRRAPSGPNIVDVLHVPLFFKVAGQTQGAIDNRIAQTVDIVPTLAESLGVAVPWEVDGESLIRAPQTKRERIRYLNADKTLTELEALQLDLGEALQHKAHLMQTYFSRIASSWNPPQQSKERTALQPNSLRCSGWIEAPEVYRSVKLASKSLPALLQGEVRCEGELGSAAELELRFNDNHVGSKSVTLDRRGVGGFTFLIDERFFREGVNEIFLTLVSGASVAEVKLDARAPVELVSAEPGREQLVVSEASTLPLVAGAVQGYLDVVKIAGSSVALEGWAVDPVKKKAVESVVLFCDGAYMGQVVPRVARFDVAALFPGASLTHSGYQAHLSLDSCGGSAPHRIRLFGITANAAAELVYGNAVQKMKQVHFGK
ncbi:MAG: sulfatase-like hydrolase/transferase [Deltaproteobacteria bacterium]|nr:sulfatase-like hydrolase/transferase [Deltaproteobacteria bacterium]